MSHTAAAHGRFRGRERMARAARLPTTALFAASVGYVAYELLSQLVSLQTMTGGNLNNS